MKESFKIGLVSAFPPSKVTLNEYGYYLAKHFANNINVEKIFLYSDYTSESKQLDFENSEKIEDIPCWNFNSYSTLFSVLKQIINTKPDIVIINAHFLKFGDRKIPAALGLMLGFFIRLIGKKSIFLIHNIMEKVDLDKAGFTSNPILNFIYNVIGYTLTRFILGSNLVTVTIDQYVNILESKYKSKNIAMIPHGTFEEAPLPTFDTIHPVKKIMTFGKFGTYKKVEQMIEAVEILRQRTPYNYEIIIAGTDSPNTPGYLENVSKKYSHVANIHFTGYVPEADVEKYFNESTVVIFPYTSTTGSSGVLHQAGNYGKAVIMPKIDDFVNLIEDEGYRGEYFEPESVDSLAQAIDNIVSNDSYRYRLEKTNYNAAMALPMKDIVRWYIFHIQEILGQKKNLTTPFSKTIEVSALTNQNYREITMEIESEIDKGVALMIDLEELSEIDLAGFNALIHTKTYANEKNIALYFSKNAWKKLNKWNLLTKMSKNF